MTEPILVARNVQKRYGSAVAIAGIDLSIARGELFGLLGPNGAGKTTLMSILSGLADADGGTVELFGKPFRASDRDLRKRVGLATQDLAIYPDLTARENLTFFAKLYGLGGSDLTSRVAEMLAAVGLTERANDRAGTFSGGMKRRLNLAVAVVHRPEILLLDEPTTGVDPQSRNHIFEQVRAQNAAGLTVVYTSHYMEEVQALCPRIAVMDAGRVQACDTLPNLLARLDALARFRFPTAVPATLAESAGTIPGVKRATAKGNVLEVSATDLAPLLPRLLAAFSATGLETVAIDLEQPTLERVFLSLTGHELRD